MSAEQKTLFPESEPSISDDRRGNLAQQIPVAWRPVLREAVSTESFRKLERFLVAERRQHTVFPSEPDVFNALKLTAPSDVKVVILGQDPYHGDGQAHGLSFSVRPGVKLPPSLKNIFKELSDDLSLEQPQHGCLEHWAKQGVLLLNTVLTVRAHAANSHRKRGWEDFTDAVIQAVNDQPHVVFVLWGSPAQKKAALIDESRHLIIKSAHPSPLSARRGFFGSQPFSKANEWMKSQGAAPIDWCIPD